MIVSITIISRELKIINFSWFIPILCSPAYVRRTIERKLIFMSVICMCLALDCAVLFMGFCLFLYGYILFGQYLAVHILLHSFLRNNVFAICICLDQLCNSVFCITRYIIRFFAHFPNLVFILSPTPDHVLCYLYFCITRHIILTRYVIWLFFVSVTVRCIIFLFVFLV